MLSRRVGARVFFQACSLILMDTGVRCVLHLSVHCSMGTNVQPVFMIHHLQLNMHFLWHCIIDTASTQPCFLARPLEKKQPRSKAVT